MDDHNDKCRRCGNCCRGMIWMKSYSYDDAFSLVKKPASEIDVEIALAKKYISYLNSLGLPVEKIKKFEWNNKRKQIIVHAKVGQCAHLLFVNDKAVCRNYENRPKQCRNYLCKKIRKDILEERTRVSESGQDLTAEASN